MRENIVTVRLEIRDGKVRKSLEEAISPLEGFRIQKSFSIPSDILILEIRDNSDKEFQLIQDVQISGMATEVFLTSFRLEPDLLIQALRVGAKEFFSQPIQGEEVKAALLKFKERKERNEIPERKKKKGKILDVMGSKGGIGTTTVAVNLATSLSQSEASPSVALIDMNLLFGEIPIFLNIESAFNWGEVAKDVSRLDATYLMSILSKHSSNVYILPSPTALDGVNVGTPEIIEKILYEMQEVFDFIVVDGGQSMDDTSLKILEISDMVLLVAILSLPCLTNMKRLLWIFQKLGHPSPENIRILINRYHKNSEISPKEAQKSINKEIFWFVPNDYLTTMSAINRGKTLSSIAPMAEISQSFLQLANHFLGNGGEIVQKGGFTEVVKKNRFIDRFLRVGNER
jgi:pilus assembly protein CpaE